MKEKTNIDVETLRIIYSRYKKHIIYGGTIAICLFFFIFFTIPKTLELSELNKERTVEIKKLQVLNGNLFLLRTLNDNDLDQKLQTASRALPSSKDFEGILNAISLASNKSGASLNDYSFVVGELSKSSDANSGFPSVKLTLSLRASSSQIIAFLKNLSETVPLSEVTNISQKKDSVAITALFYYKSVDTNSLSSEARLSGISPKHLTLIDTISSWDTPFASVVSTPEGTKSASPF